MNFSLSVCRKFTGRYIRFKKCNTLAVPLPSFETKTIYTPFPWRPRKLQYSLIRRSFQNFLVGSLLSRNVGSGLTEKEICLGANRAFELATTSIFQHPYMIAHKNSNSNNKISVEPPLLFDDLFEDKLATFYQYAIERHCLNPRHITTYSLEKITKTSISLMEIVGGARRGMDFSGMFRISLFGLGYMNGRASNEGTLRMWIDIECVELFSVIEKSTGKLIQGSLQPTIVTHQLLLENVLVDPKDIGDAELCQDWAIVDIDNWLCNNQFWANNKLIK